MIIRDLEQIISSLPEEKTAAGKVGDKDPDSENEQGQEQDFNAALKQRFVSDTFDRKMLVKWSSGIVSYWLFAVILILVFNRIILISDEVLIALLVTTTLNVLGLSFIVLKGLFPGIGGKENS